MGSAICAGARGEDTRPGSGRGEDERPGNGRGEGTRPDSARGEDERPGSGRGEDTRPGSGRCEDTPPDSRCGMSHIAVRAGEGRFLVRLEATVAPDGGGLVCYLYGGEAPHVGGQALAAPGPKLGGRQLSRADVWDATVPGHKDAEAARGVARRLAIVCRQAVSVTAGIHVEGATADDLALLGRNIDACVDALLTELGVADDGR